jgi:hypothetical protein
VLSKLAYLTLCRSIQLLALLARGEAAKDLEILAGSAISGCSNTTSRPSCSPFSAWRSVRSDTCTILVAPGCSSWREVTGGRHPIRPSDGQPALALDVPVREAA